MFRPWPEILHTALMWNSYNLWTLLPNCMLSRQHIHTTVALHLTTRNWVYLWRHSSCISPSDTHFNDSLLWSESIILLKNVASDTIQRKNNVPTKISRNTDTSWRVEKGSDLDSDPRRTSEDSWHLARFSFSPAEEELVVRDCVPFQPLWTIWFNFQRYNQFPVNPFFKTRTQPLSQTNALLPALNKGAFGGIIRISHSASRSQIPPTPFTHVFSRLTMWHPSAE